MVLHFSLKWGQFQWPDVGPVRGFMPLELVELELLVRMQQYPSDLVGFGHNPSKICLPLSFTWNEFYFPFI